MNNRAARRALRATPGHIILAALAIIALFPIALVLLNALKDAPEVVRNPLALPEKIDWANFLEAWTYGNFGRGFVNSILLSGTTIVTVLVTATPAAFVLAARKIKIAGGVMIYLMMAMTVPIQLFLFPLYAAFAQLGLLSNVFAVGVVIAAINMPLSVLLLRTFFLRIPAELPEAAAMDGANTGQVLRHILMPAVSPGLITVGIVVGLMAWNEYLISVTFLQDPGSYTATLGFLSLTGTFAVDQGVLMAGAALLIIPIIAFFLIAQRKFVDGFVSGSVKG
ncbi:ABC transporter permease subunit [Pseudactinotalea sp. HY160]|uniref:carbohydrate ABC transporter permease n=1 Tax=Pseudactinotalea sp. HY160 TaxID=2654490 RepID=UPI00128BAAAE|nr:carbohydrate ABC transporter permease [Pseudactinotalea sp. HY160]MPV50679.1 ABC transporter permease subunit [Pseudactinotalea sp. HY160]